MNKQQTLNKLKIIVHELFDLLIKKQLDGLEADDKTIINKIKGDVAKIKTNMSTAENKISIIQKTIQLVEELIEDLNK